MTAIPRSRPARIKLARRSGRDVDSRSGARGGLYLGDPTAWS